jgi:hypothetical protein
LRELVGAIDAPEGGMDYEDSLTEAARRANNAVRQTMKDYGSRYVVDEDDINGYLVGALKAHLETPSRIGNLYWTATILRHRKGMAAEEKKYGADILIHVRLDTLQLKYSKGVLVQAKHLDPDAYFSPQNRTVLTGQCNKMLGVTPAAFVFAYAKRGMRCGSASTIVGSSSTQLYCQCSWTSYRFF